MIAALGYLVLVVAWAFLILVFLDWLASRPAPAREVVEQRTLVVLDAPYNVANEKDAI